MKAVGRNILIKPFKKGTEKTKGGLLLSEVQRTDVRYHRGKVLSTGDQVCGIKKDDEIFFDKSAYHRIDIDNKDYCIVRDTDVVVIL
jgi:co-chaperonin GroES (HSP10)|tara:strand:+ start:105 stop:365 length:261 start_codon:yes stop_codon:yes gene_type:complete